MTNKIGRNEPCPCGSGLKYKKCCFAKKIIHYHNQNPKVIVNKEEVINTLESIFNSKKIAAEGENTYYRIFWDDNIEKVNPIDYYKNFELNRRIILYRDLLEVKDPILTSQLSDDFLIRFAKKELDKEKFWEIREQTEVPENFLKLFETTRKKDQLALLKGASINVDQLISLIFKSYKDYGYLYSKYRFENLPKDLKGKKKPKLANILENGSVKIIGETDLKDGQVKNMIEQRKVIIAHFFDKDEYWHCLLLTYSSINGRENWKDGQAHFHYISNFFGIKREDFIESMKVGQYKSLSSIHIDLLGYGNQVITSKNIDD